MTLFLEKCECWSFSVAIYLSNAQLPHLESFPITSSHLPVVPASFHHTKHSEEKTSGTKQRSLGSNDRNGRPTTILDRHD